MSGLRKKIKQLLWDDFFGKRQTLRLTIIYSVPFVVIFTALIISLVVREARQHAQEQTEEFLEAARSFHKQVMVEKEWMEEKGGLFVRSGDGNKVVPGPDADSYRRIDFASALNTQSEIAGRTKGYRFHIARPHTGGNYHHPDEWEAEALRSLQNGSYEEFSFIRVNGTRYFRYMSPFSFEPDPSGTGSKPATGITITIPTSVSDIIHREKMKRDFISYGSIGIISLLFIITLIWRFSRKITLVIDKEMEEKRLKALVELAGAAAHEIRQPLAVIVGYSDILKHNISPEERQVNDTVAIIKDQCGKINGIISKMLRITQYRTIPYLDDIRIFDLNSVDTKRSKN